MRQALHSALILFALGVVLGSCKKDPETPEVVGTGRRIFVVCEGSYGSGNSALTLYNPDSVKVIEDAFRSANGQSLGDVFQSMIRLKSGAYLLCVNNSDVVIRIDGTTLKETARTTVLQPRYALETTSDRVLVTTMYSNKAYWLDAAAMRVTDSVTLPYQNPEALAEAGGRIWICPWDTACNRIYPYNPVSRSLEPPVVLPGRAPQAALTDKDGKLWVLSGNSYKGVESWLTRIDPATGAIMKQFRFGAADPVRPILNPAGDSLYFIEVSYTGGSVNNGVYRMSIHDAALPAAAFIPASGLQYYWGLGIDPKSNELYVADPLGFTQRGRIAVYGLDGSFRRSFNSGVGPGHFCFD